MMVQPTKKQALSCLFFMFNFILFYVHENMWDLAALVRLQTCSYLKPPRIVSSYKESENQDNRMEVDAK